jgi:hypothetical protein
MSEHVQQVQPNTTKPAVAAGSGRILQRKAASPGLVPSVPPIVHEVLASPGQPLDPATRTFMELRFGHDFSRVRVHADAQAAESARTVNARAYTVGNNVVFDAGNYAPRTNKGLRLMAHELAHTIQQNESGTQPLRLADDDGQEREAERAAAAIPSGRFTGVAPGSTSRSLSRQKNDAVPGQFLQELHGGRAEPELDYWEKTARQVFAAASYNAYCASLKTTNFFGTTIKDVHDDLAQMLHTAETTILSQQGPGYKPPHIDSTLRKKKGMHGWGMAVDFDVLTNPYVLNESGEKDLDRDLTKAYDRIASFMLGKSTSDLGKLKGGRAAFGGSISNVYDVLHDESDAMKRYFSMRNNDAAVRAFLANEWPARHLGQPSPDIAAVKSAMQDDYEVLGGALPSGVKRSTGGKGDRPFAPVSSNFQGDPSTGFLNLDKTLVEALTTAGFAWGAVDIAGEPGDVQHFDLRLSGIGKKVYELMLG